MAWEGTWKEAGEADLKILFPTFLLIIPCTVNYLQILKAPTNAQFYFTPNYLLHVSA